MFKWINKQGVQSHKGFTVQVVGQFVIEYRDELKIISVEVEPGFLPSKKVCITIESDSFKSWDNGINISEEKQVEILQNFKDAMGFQGIHVIIED